MAKLRTGVVLDREGGALAKMLPFFKAGIGGPVAGGRQYLPWIHVDDVVGLYLAALDGEGWSGAYNGTRPGAGDEQGVLAAAWARRCTGPPSRPSPPSRSASSTATWPRSSPRASARCPRRALAQGFAFRHPDLDEALRAALRARPCAAG